MGNFWFDCEQDLLLDRDRLWGTEGGRFLALVFCDWECISIDHSRLICGYNAANLQVGGSDRAARWWHYSHTERTMADAVRVDGCRFDFLLLHSRIDILSTVQPLSVKTATGEEPSNPSR
jgi:hypothetical protein